MRLGNLVRARQSLCIRRDMKTHAARQFLIGGNWKCNGSVESVKTLVADLNAGSVPSDVEIVCAPTFVHLPMVKDSLSERFQISAQNCWTGPPGAFTGEVSADMLSNMNIPWVITGHSERRALCGESSAQVAEKTAYAIGKGLKVIACIGETLPQRESGELWNVLTEQMAAIKDAIALGDWDKVVIAYEPVWAIGTGVVATPEQAQEVHAWVRNWMADNVAGSVASSVRILYGGSVKGGNCGELALKPDIDGFLVGGASLDGKEFVTICNATATPANAA